MVYFDTMSSDVAVEVDAGVAVLTLDRPDQLNAYTAEMGTQLSRAYRDCDDDDDVRAIVITGAGRAFCAGADFSGSASPFDTPADDFSASPIDPAAFELRKPVIAAVNGHAVGIGLTIALQADMRIVADDAKYAVAQVRRGVIPGLHVALDAGAADQPGCGGRGVAHRAHIHRRRGRLRGVSPIARCPPRRYSTDALAIARDIATNVAPMSAALCKRLLWDSVSHGYSPRQVAALETQLHHRVMGTDDAREGVAAFRERRAPRFNARLSTDWTPLPAPEL